MSINGISRRDFLGCLGLTAAAGLLGSNHTIGATATEAEPVRGRRHQLRFCHLSDIHMWEKRNAEGGLTKALQYVNHLDPKPNLLVTGGDNIMDALGASHQQAAEQFALLSKVLQDHTDIPVKHCLGNHDIWGWNKEKSQTTGQESGWGAKWAVETYDMPNAYYHFDRGGWRFVILNTIQPDAEGKGVYVGGIDEAQFDWLTQTLKDTNADVPVVLVCHIPILTVCNSEKKGRIGSSPDEWRSAICMNSPQILKLFTQHPNVKLCLSGHHHNLDRIEYHGVCHICDGAVSGSWWRGDTETCDEGLGVIDLYSDGTFNHQYHGYGWNVDI